MSIVASQKTLPELKLRCVHQDTPESRQFPPNLSPPVLYIVSVEFAFLPNLAPVIRDTSVFRRKFRQHDCSHDA